MELHVFGDGGEEGVIYADPDNEQETLLALKRADYIDSIRGLHVVHHSDDSYQIRDNNGEQLFFLEGPFSYSLLDESDDEDDEDDEDEFMDADD